MLDPVIQNPAKCDVHRVILRLLTTQNYKPLRNRPAYSAFFAPTYFHLFKELKNDLREKRFETNDEVKLTAN